MSIEHRLQLSTIGEIRHAISTCLEPNRTTKLTGFMVHWCLFSTLSVQTCASFLYGRALHSSAADLYYDAAVNDRLLTRCLVYGVYMLEFVQTAFVTYDAFKIFALGFGDLESLTAVHFHWLTIPVMSAIGNYPLSLRSASY